MAKYSSFLIKIIIALFGLVLTLYIAICWNLSSQILQPSTTAKDLASLQRLQSKKSAEFTVHSLGTVRGEIPFWHYQNKKGQNKHEAASCTIIMAHGWGATRLQMRKYFAAFEQFGCNYLIYDHRGHGMHKADFGSGGIIEKQDLLALVDWLQTQKGMGAEQIGLFGLSWGGATALQAAAVSNNVAFVVADSAFADWDSAIFERGIKLYGGFVKSFRLGINLMIYVRTGLWYKQASAVNNAEAITVPTLLIHSNTDSKTASSQSEAIYSRLNPSIRRFHHTHWGADHVGDFDVQPEAYTQLIAGFVHDFKPKFGERANN